MSHSTVQYKRTVYDEKKTEKIRVNGNNTGFLKTQGFSVQRVRDSVGIHAGFSVGMGWVRGLKSSNPVPTAALLDAGRRGPEGSARIQTASGCF